MTQALGPHVLLFTLGLWAAEALRPELNPAARALGDEAEGGGQARRLSVAAVAADGQVQTVPVAEAEAKRVEEGIVHKVEEDIKNASVVADMMQPDWRALSVMTEVGSGIASAASWEKLPANSSATATLLEIGPPKWWARIGDLGRHVFAGISVTVLVKIACMVGNLLVQVSPMPQAQEWEGKGTTGSTESAPYVAMGLGGWQWCTYGFAAWTLTQNDGFLVLVYANCFGALLGSYYTFVFYRNCRDSGMFLNLQKYFMVVSCLIVVQTLMWLEVPHRRALACHSCIAGGCSFVGAAALLTGLPAVLSSGDTSGICGPLVVANFFGAFLWAYYGVMMDDCVVIGVNIFAAFSSALCLYAKFFHRQAPASQDSTKDPATKFVH